MTASSGGGIAEAAGISAGALSAAPPPAGCGRDEAARAFHALCAERITALVSLGRLGVPEVAAALRQAGLVAPMLPPLVRAERFLYAALAVAGSAPQCPPLTPFAPSVPHPAPAPDPSLRLSADLAARLKVELRERVLRCHQEASVPLPAEEGEYDDISEDESASEEDTAGGGAMEPATPQRHGAGGKYYLNPVLTLGDGEREAWGALIARLAELVQHGPAAAAISGAKGGAETLALAQRLLMLTSVHFADAALAPNIARGAHRALQRLYSAWHRDWFSKHDYAVLKAVVKRALYASGAAQPKAKSEGRRARLVQRRKVFKQRKRLYEEEEKHRRRLLAAGIQQVSGHHVECGISAQERAERSELEGEFGHLIQRLHYTRAEAIAAEQCAQRFFPIVNDFLSFLETEYDSMLVDLRPPTPPPAPPRRAPRQGLAADAHLAAVDGIFAEHSAAFASLLGELQLPSASPSPSTPDS